MCPESSRNRGLLRKSSGINRISLGWTKFVRAEVQSTEQIVQATATSHRLVQWSQFGQQPCQHDDLHNLFSRHDISLTVCFADTTAFSSRYVLAAFRVRPIIRNARLATRDAAVRRQVPIYDLSPPDAIHRAADCYSLPWGRGSRAQWAMRSFMPIRRAERGKRARRDTQGKGDARPSRSCGMRPGETRRYTVVPCPPPPHRRRRTPGVSPPTTPWSARGRPVYYSDRRKKTLNVPTRSRYSKRARECGWKVKKVRDQTWQRADSESRVRSGSRLARWHFVRREILRPTILRMSSTSISFFFFSGNLVVIFLRQLY